jgi:hypothetical protein
MANKKLHDTIFVKDTQYHNVTYTCQGHTRTQYYIYKAIPIIAEEMIEKKLWL